MEPRAAIYHFLLVAVTCAQPLPAPGRVPKVYNALITSNQNLEPSKAYPVYQPVLHNAYPFHYHPLVYQSDIPSLYPVAANIPPPQPSVATPSEKTPSSELPPAPEAPESPPTDSPKTDDKKSSKPQEPPSTESPIPINQFGLPAQLVPIDGSQWKYLERPYNAFPPVTPFSYQYPTFRYYDSFDPFGINPYYNLYRPFPNVLNSIGPSQAISAEPAPAPKATEKPKAGSITPPPSNPSELNILNYSGKDPAIPDVPPPPLPKGGLQNDKEE